MLLIRNARKGPCRECQAILTRNEVGGTWGGVLVGNAGRGGGPRRDSGEGSGRSGAGGWEPAVRTGTEAPSPGRDRPGSRCTRTGGAQGHGAGHPDGQDTPDQHDVPAGGGRRGPQRGVRPAGEGLAPCGLSFGRARGLQSKRGGSVRTRPGCGGSGSEAGRAGRVWETCARVWSPASEVLRRSGGLRGGGSAARSWECARVRACARSCTGARSWARPPGSRHKAGRGCAQASLWLSLPSPGSAEPQCVRPENEPRTPVSCLLCRFVSTPGDAGNGFWKARECRFRRGRVVPSQMEGFLPLISSPLPPSPGHGEHGDPESVAPLDFGFCVWSGCLLLPN